MNKTLRRNFRQSALRLIGTFIAIGLLIFLLSQQGWEEIIDAIRQIPLQRFLLAFTLIFLSRLAIAGRWYALLQSAEAGLSALESTRITFAGLFASNFLPTTIGGDVVRLAGAIQLGSKRALSAASIAVDRLIGIFTMATALPFGLIPLFQWLSLNAMTPDPSSQLALGASSLSVGNMTKQAWMRGRGIIQRLLEALSFWVRQPRSLIWPVALSWAHMFFRFAAIGLLLSAMGQSISFWLIAGLWSFTYFVTLLPISINGLGLQEVSMTFIFANIGGVSMHSALTAALLFRTLEMAASLPGVLFLPNIVAGQDTPEGE